MARIRSLKPDLPQSGSMGRVSREARLAFMLLFTVADDEGRLRGDSRLLASTLYPYDDDAAGLIDGWLAELERESCIRRYVAGGDRYIEVINWLKHQKIDKPTPSKLPSFDDGSPLTPEPSPNAREDSRGLPVGLEGNGREGRRSEASRIPESAQPPISTAKRKTLIPDDFSVSDRVRAWATKNGHGQLDARVEPFVGWAKAGGKAYVDWDQVFMNAMRGDWVCVRPRVAPTASTESVRQQQIRQAIV